LIIHSLVAEGHAMRITKHADQRLRQRGFLLNDPELLTLLATSQGDRLVLRDRDADRLIGSARDFIRHVERLRNRCLVTDGSTVITAYRLRRPRHRLRRSSPKHLAD